MSGNPPPGFIQLVYKNQSLPAIGLSAAVTYSNAGNGWYYVYLNNLPLYIYGEDLTPNSFKGLAAGGNLVTPNGAIISNNNKNYLQALPPWLI